MQVYAVYHEISPKKQRALNIYSHFLQNKGAHVILLVDKTSSIYLDIELMPTARQCFLSRRSFE